MAGLKVPLSAARHMARHYAMQALYQWHMAGQSISDIEAQFRADYDMEKVDTEFFAELLHNIPAKLDEIDNEYQGLLDRESVKLDPVEQALLRIGVYELKYRIDVPYKVVINEAVNLAKKFGATDSFKYINGVLDKVAVKQRQVEKKS